MTIDYTVDEKDHLTYQLFVASKSDRIRKKRLRAKILQSLICVGFGLLFLLEQRITISIIFFCVGVLWYFLYPIWERWYYVKHFQSHIKEHLKNGLGRAVSLEINDEYIVVREEGVDSKIVTAEVAEISDIPTTIFIMLKGGQALILPKDKITKAELLGVRLKDLAQYLNIKYHSYDTWVWK